MKPKYLDQPEIKFGTVMRVWIKCIQIILNVLVRIVLQPRIGPIKNLDICEVEQVYDREASGYDAKHHLTTRGMDTTWRRLAGWCAVTSGLKNNGTIKILDLCTGTGLTTKEMAVLLANWGICASITGLDYNQRMLDVANRRQIKESGVEVSFIRGDAMNLVSNGEPQNEGLLQLPMNSFDVITQMFGIGGISNPLAVFQGVIRLLKVNGTFFLTDMHRPIINQPGEWPLLFKWFRFPKFEAITYRETTLPLVLNRLWGWRDTTLDFYQLPLISYCDYAGKFWGFEIQSLEVESQRWWFALPIMPVAKIIVKLMR